MRQLPVGAKLFALRLATVPFETALAILGAWTGFAGLFGLTLQGGMFKAVLPDQLVMGFNLLYVLAGVMMVAGVGWGYRNVEASGLVLLATTLAVRAFAIVFRIGWEPETATLIIQAVVFITACGVRLTTLLKSVVEISVGENATRAVAILSLLMISMALIGGDTVSILVALIGGGGIITGIVALFKIKPEVARVTVDAAEGAVVVQSGVIKSLREEIERLSCEIREERESCQREMAELREKYEREMAELRRAFEAIDERKTQRRDEDVKQ